MNIEFKEGAVCYADGVQRFCFNGDHLISTDNNISQYKSLVKLNNFKLNEIKKGDYIPASELDTEQKYNNAAEVFGLFGFLRGSPFALNYDIFMLHPNEDALVCSENLLMGVGQEHKACKRKITFNQLMAIGKLKRMMNERDNAVLQHPQAPSPEMASEINDDEWPKVGDEVTWIEREIIGTVKCIDNGIAWIRCPNGYYTNQKVSRLKPPKSKEDLLIEELQAKLVENNAVDNWMLAASIINGDIEGLTYKGDSDD